MLKPPFMYPSLRRSISIFLIAVTICILLYGCSIIPGSAPTITPEPPTTIPATETPAITPTPTLPPGKVILYAPLNLDSQWVAETQELLTPLAKSSNLILDVRTELQKSDIAQDWRIAVFLSTPADIQDYASAAPNTQFVAVTAADLAPAANLSIIRIYPEREYFLAGYIATLISDDWRSAGLFASDGAYAPNDQNAFLNGGYYWCGRCNSIRSPIVSFPLVASGPQNSALSSWRTALDTLLSNIIYVIYLSPEATTPELINYLVNAKMIMFGSRTPQADILPRWAVTIQQDHLTALQEMWPKLVEGQGGQSGDATLKLADINKEYLTPGRQQQAEKVIADLAKGWIDPVSSDLP